MAQERGGKNYKSALFLLFFQTLSMRAVILYDQVQHMLSLSLSFSPLPFLSIMLSNGCRVSSPSNCQCPTLRATHWALSDWCCCSVWWSGQKDCTRCLQVCAIQLIPWTGKLPSSMRGCQISDPLLGLKVTEVIIWKKMASTVWQPWMPDRTFPGAFGFLSHTFSCWKKCLSGESKTWKL